MNTFDTNNNINSLIIEILFNSDIGYTLNLENYTLFEVDTLELLARNKTLKIGRRAPIKNEFLYRNSWFFIYIEKEEITNNFIINFNFFDFFQVEISYDAINDKIYFKQKEIKKDEAINIINQVYSKNKNLFFSNVLINYDENYFEKIKPIKNEKEFIDHVEILKISKY